MRQLLSPVKHIAILVLPRLEQPNEKFSKIRVVGPALETQTSCIVIQVASSSGTSSQSVSPDTHLHVIGRLVPLIVRLNLETLPW